MNLCQLKSLNYGHLLIAVMGDEYEQDTSGKQPSLGLSWLWSHGGLPYVNGVFLVPLMSI